MNLSLAKSGIFSSTYNLAFLSRISVLKFNPYFNRYYSGAKKLSTWFML